jgi:hypothetical protein
MKKLSLILFAVSLLFSSMNFSCAEKKDKGGEETTTGQEEGYKMQEQDSPESETEDTQQEEDLPESDTGEKEQY